MAILEKIASHILSFEKMSLIDKEKLKIAEETHYKLQKTKGKLHNITVYKNGGVNRILSTNSWSESMRMEKSVAKLGQRSSLEHGQKMYLKKTSKSTI